MSVNSGERQGAQLRFTPDNSFFIFSPQPTLGIQLGRSAPQLELEDVVAAESTERLARAYLLSATHADRGEVAIY